MQGELDPSVASTDTGGAASGAVSHGSASIARDVPPPIRRDSAPFHNGHRPDQFFHGYEDNANNVGANGGNDGGAVVEEDGNDDEEKVNGENEDSKPSAWECTNEQTNKQTNKLKK